MMGTRIWIFRVFVLIVLALLLSRLAYLQLVRGNYYEKLAEENRARSIPIEAPRGVIFDRNGKPLVKNDISFMLAAVPEEVAGHLSVINTLSSVLGLDRKKILKKLLHGDNPSLQVTLKEHLSFAEFADLSEYLPLPGIYPIETPIRHYLHPLRDAHLLGYVGEISEGELKQRKSEGLEPGDITGQDGIEKNYDPLLRGKNGAQEVEVDAAGKFVRVLSEIQPLPGANLSLTIDETVQEAAWEAVQEGIQALRKRNGVMTPGTVVALDPNTGEILAYTAWPSFNPGWFARGITGKEYESLLKGSFNPLLNRPIEAAYPTGSTFKMITGSAGLEENKITPEKPLYCPGYFHIPGITFHCFVRSGHGWIKFPEAVALSCDVYFYQVAYRLGIELLDKFAGLFGIGQTTGVDLPGESGGLLPTPKWKEKAYGEPWYPADSVNMGIGQGYLQVTPLQLAVVTSIVANGGTYWRPHFFLRAFTPEGAPVTENIPKYPKEVRTVPVLQKNLAMVRLGMKGAVDHGTATAAKIPGIVVAGKTGTAENVPTFLNPKGRNHAWFVSFAPYYDTKAGSYPRKPEIVVVVMMEQSGGFGGELAAPVAQKILLAYFKEKHEIPVKKPLAKTSVKP